MPVFFQNKLSPPSTCYTGWRPMPHAPRLRLSNSHDTLWGGKPHPVSHHLLSLTSLGASVLGCSKMALMRGSGATRTAKISKGIVLFGAASAVSNRKTQNQRLNDACKLPGPAREGANPIRATDIVFDCRRREKFDCRRCADDESATHACNAHSPTGPCCQQRSTSQTNKCLASGTHAQTIRAMSGAHAHRLQIPVPSLPDAPTLQLLMT